MTTTPNRLTPVKRRSIRAQTEEQLRDALLSGVLRPGDKINEVVLARELSSSRGPLREALQKLEQEGLVVSFPHRGTYVRELSEREIAELQDVRLALETAAALRVAATLTPETTRKLERHLDDLDRRNVESATLAECLQADFEFHEAVCVASGNETLCELWRALIGRMTVMLLAVDNRSRRAIQGSSAHRPLLDAIVSGDEAEIRETYWRVFEDGKQIVIESSRVASDDAGARPLEGETGGDARPSG